MKPASKTDRAVNPKPEKREPLAYDAEFCKSDTDRLMLGLVPLEMEDKWFVYFEDGWLYLHRSWTGAMIYWLKLDETTNGFRVAESWVNREPKDYKGDDIEYDRQLLDFLIRRVLLGQEIPFPIRKEDREKYPPSACQHNFVGKAFPEKPC